MTSSREATKELAAAELDIERAAPFEMSGTLTGLSIGGSALAQPHERLYAKPLQLANPRFSMPVLRG